MTDNNSENKSKIYEVIIERLVPMQSVYHIQAPNQEKLEEEVNEYLNENDDSPSATIVHVECIEENAENYTLPENYLTPNDSEDTVH